MIRGPEFRLVARKSGRSESGVARNAKNQHSTRQDPIQKYTSWRGTTRINRRLRSSLASLNAAERDDLPNRWNAQSDWRPPNSSIGLQVANRGLFQPCVRFLAAP